MSLRRKTIVIVGVTLASLIAALYIVSQIILLQSYTNLETQTTAKNLQRGLNALNNAIAVIHGTNLDWAHWNDSYQFVEDQNQAYIDANIYDSVFSIYNVNFMLYYNADGKLVYGKGFDLQGKQETPIPDTLKNLSADSPLLNHMVKDQLDLNGISGLIMLPEGPVLVSSVPIVQSNLEGPAHGSLIWARYLDDALIKDMGNKTSLSIQVIPYGKADMPADYQQAMHTFADPSNATPSNGLVSKNADGQPSLVMPLDGDTIAAYSPLTDLSGQNALMFRVDMPRSIYQQGQSTLSYFLLSLFTLGVVFLGVTLILLERTVLSRLAYLNWRVNRIRTSTDISMRVDLPGQDELANLAHTINGMLEALQTQEHLRRTRDEAIEASRLKSQILANVSHDARTPLSVILLRADALRNGLYGELHEGQLRVVESIVSNGQQLLSFINNLLEMAQLTSGKPPKLNVSAFSPAELLTDITSSMQALASTKSLELTSELDSNLPALLCGDRQRVHQILLNLVGNAIKFTQQGKVHIRAFEQDAAHWTLQISDTGSGIAKEDQERIFEAFWQVDGSHTRSVTTGVGLGLSIVKQLVDLMHGEVKLESELGKGSTFTVILPLEANVLEGKTLEAKVMEPYHAEIISTHN